MTARLTPHQKYALARLTAMSGGEGHWVRATDAGCVGGLRRSWVKGHLARKVERGPRGGEHVFYRPIRFGEEGARAADVFERMPTGEIDSRLIEARENGEVVLCYFGPGVYYRGVPGEVERGDDGVLRLHLGQRQIALKGILRVEPDAGGYWQENPGGVAETLNRYDRIYNEAK